MTTIQIRPNVPDHLLLIMGATPAHRVALHILIQILIGIQIRAVAREIKNSDSILMPFEPLLHLGRDMNGMLVNNQKDIPGDLAEQTSQKLRKHLALEPLLKNHKVQPPPVRNRRNHITSKTLARPRDDRRLSTTPIRTTTGMVRSKSHLISPINLGLLLSGQPSNLWILLFQPPTHLLGILLEGFAHGFLRSEPPLRQITPHCPPRQTNRKFPFNQLRHRLPSPKIERELQLFRIPVNYSLRNLSRLPGQKGTLRRSSSLSRSKSSRTPFPIFLDPLSHCLASHAEELRRFNLFFPLHDRPQDFPTKIFLGYGGKGSSISHFHALSIAFVFNKCKLFYAPISKNRIVHSVRITLIFSSGFIFDAMRFALCVFFYFEGNGWIRKLLCTWPREYTGLPTA